MWDGWWGSVEVGNVSQRLLIDKYMAFDIRVRIELNSICFHWSIYCISCKIVASKNSWTLLASLSHRGPEFWPGCRHRDWCSVGSGHRHRCGDCCGAEDGQVLVSTSYWLNAGSYINVVL